MFESQGFHDSRVHDITLEQHLSQHYKARITSCGEIEVVSQYYPCEALWIWKAFEGSDVGVFENGFTIIGCPYNI